MLRRQTLDDPAFRKAMERQLGREVDTLQWDRWFHDYIQARFPLDKVDPVEFVSYLKTLPKSFPGASDKKPWWFRRPEGQARTGLLYPEVVSRQEDGGFVSRR